MGRITFIGPQCCLLFDTTAPLFWLANDIQGKKKKNDWIILLCICRFCSVSLVVPSSYPVKKCRRGYSGPAAAGLLFITLAWIGPLFSKWIKGNFRDLDSYIAQKSMCVTPYVVEGGGEDIENKKRKKSPSTNLVRSNWIGWEMTWGLEKPSTEASRVIIGSIPSEMSSLLLFFSPFSSVGFFIRRQRRNGRRSSFFFSIPLLIGSVVGVTVPKVMQDIQKRVKIALVFSFNK